MPKQIFSAGAAPRVTVTGCGGDLAVSVWEQRAIEVTTDSSEQVVYQEDEGLTIANAAGDVRLWVPAETTIAVRRQGGDVTISGVAALTIEGSGDDVRATAISGAIRLSDIAGDLDVAGGESLTLTGRVGGDARIRDVATVEIEHIGGDLAVAAAQTVIVSHIAGDCVIGQASESLRYGEVGGDLRLDGAGRTMVVGGSVGCDLALAAIGGAQIGAVGGDAKVRDVHGDARIGSVGGDCAVNAIDGALSIGHVGGDADIRAPGKEVQIGNVGDDLSLQSLFAVGSTARIAVGGDARIILPDQPNVAIRATVGGEISGPRVASPGGMCTIVYGEGAAQLELIVGGDLVLRGGGAPRSSNAAWGEWADFCEQMGGMTATLGEEFGRMGEELGRELSEAFGGWSEHKGAEWSHKAAHWADHMRRRVDERLREANERQRRAEEGVRQSGGHGGRVHVRINDREWRMDPERLERIKRQARDAAREGVVGALEAVERALAGLGMAPPSRPQAPPPPPPPSPPPPATGATIKIDREQAAAAEQTAAPVQQADIDAERAAILRMVAEGRITPEEGDMLLDALG